MARQVKERNPLRPHEQPDDETDGRVFFEIPQLIVVEHPKKSTNMSTSPNPVTDIAGAEKTGIRTASCNFDGALRKPDGYPEVVGYGCTKSPDIGDANDYLVRNEIHGYGKGTIVSRRWAMPWRFMYHHQWGIIHAVHYTPRKGVDWFPYTVKWFEVGQEEGAWAEDLLVIHACMDDELLISIVEEQGVDVSEARNMMEQRRKGAV